MKTSVRCLALLLTLLLLLPGTLSCSGSPDTPQTTPTPTATVTEAPSASPTEEEEEDVNPYNIPDNLPETTAYKGKDFSILVMKDWDYTDFYQDKLSGNAIDDSVYAAIANTEERYGVTILVDTTGLEDATHVNLISNAIASGANDFDIARVHDVLGAEYSLQGTLTNLHEMKYIDTSMPWYSAATVNSLTYMGQWYLFSSSMTYNGMSAAGCMFFNKTLMKNLGMKEPYARVLSGDWYLEDVVRDLENVHIDANNDGIKDADDTFGIVVSNGFWFWFENFGVELVKVDKESEELILNIDCTEAYDLVESMYDLFVGSDTGWMIDEGNLPEVFSSGHALYINGRLNWAVDIYRDKDVQYGIVPFPKLEYEQENYYAGYSDRYFIVPNSCEDPDFVSLMLEAMSAEGYRNVVPTYFDQTLKDRVTWDDDSVRMLDIINNNRLLGFAYAYGNDKWCSRAVYELLTAGTNDYAAYCERIRSAAEARIDTINEAFTKMQ